MRSLDKCLLSVYHYQVFVLLELTPQSNRQTSSWDESQPWKVPNSHSRLAPPFTLDPYLGFTVQTSGSTVCLHEIHILTPEKV